MAKEIHILEKRIYCPDCGRSHRAKSGMVVKPIASKITGKEGRFVECKGCKSLFIITYPDAEECVCIDAKELK